MIAEEKEVTEQNEINNNIFKFNQNVSSKETDFKQNDLIDFLDKINLPILSNGQKWICDGIITDNKQIFHVFLFNIRNYSPEVINVQRREAEINITLPRVHNFHIKQKRHGIFVMLYATNTKQGLGR